MDSSEHNHFLVSINKRQRYWIGSTLIAAGLVFYLEQLIQTGWLSFLILPGIGFLLLAVGLHNKKLASIIPGSILTGLGLGGFFAFYLWQDHSINSRLGMFLLLFSAGWLLIPILSSLFQKQTAWWTLIPIGAMAPVGLIFISDRIQWQDFFLFVGVGLGLAFLIWGIFTRLIGLIIPGCLILSIGPGIYLAWNRLAQANGLAQTGVMLVTFAFGWFLITILSRVISQKFIWWPLIPGGVLAMVGWGLYIGGNPSNALNFIGNTGSLGLIIFGLYLLLWKRGIHN